MQLDAMVCPQAGDATDVGWVAEEGRRMYGVEVTYTKEEGQRGTSVYFLRVNYGHHLEDEKAYDVFYMLLELFDKPPDVSYLGSVVDVESPFA